MTPSPFFKNAFLFHGVHILPGSRCHELLTAKKLKEAEALFKETEAKAAALLK